MGIHSTCEITKEHALEFIQDGINRADKEQLGSILFALYGDATLLNFKVVDNYNKEQGLKWVNIKNRFGF